MVSDHVYQPQSHIGRLFPHSQNRTEIQGKSELKFFSLLIYHVHHPLQIPVFWEVERREDIYLTHSEQVSIFLFAATQFAIIP